MLQSDQPPTPPSSVSLSGLEGRVDVTFAGNRADEASQAVRGAWSHALVDPAKSGPGVGEVELVLDDNPEVVAAGLARGALASAELHILMHWLSQIVTLRLIDARAGQIVMLHGCAIASPTTGRAIAAVGGSGSGKTTFVSSLGRGRVYLTDEAVGVEDDLTIVPYPKPLSVLATGVGSFKDQACPDRFGLLQPTGHVHLTELWFLNRKTARMLPTVVSLTTLEALTTIAPQVSYLSSMENPLKRLAATIEAAGGLKLVTYHEVADLKSHVAAALGEPR